MIFVVEKYKNKWAVLDTKTCVWYYWGRGRRFCEKQAKILNELVVR